MTTGGTRQYDASQTTVYLFSHVTKERIRLHQNNIVSTKTKLGTRMSRTYTIRQSRMWITGNFTRKQLQTTIHVCNKTLLLHSNSIGSSAHRLEGYRTTGVRFPAGVFFFSSPRPDRICGPPILLSSTYGSFPGNKSAEVPHLTFVYCQSSECVDLHHFQFSLHDADKRQILNRQRKECANGLLRFYTDTRHNNRDTIVTS